MKFIKTFLFFIISIYKLLSEELIFCEQTTHDPNADVNVDVAKKNLGITTLKGEEGSPSEPKKETDDKDKTGDKDKNIETDDKDKNIKTADKDKGVEGDETNGTIKFGDKEISIAEFEKVYEDTKKDYGDNFDKLDKEMKMRILNDRYNLRSDKRELDKTHQKQAAREKDLTAEEEKLTDRKKKLDTFEANITAEETRLKAITAKNPDDEYDDEKRAELKLDIRDAKKDLKKIEDLKKELSDERDNLKLDHDINIYIAAKKSLLDVYPDDFKTDMPIEDINENPDAATPEDRRVLRKFKRVYEDYMSETTPEQRKKYTLAKYYEEEKDSYPAIKRSSSQTTDKDKNKDKETEKETSAKKLFRELSNNGEPPTPPAGTGSGMSGDTNLSEPEKKMKKSASERLIGLKEIEP